MDDLYSEMIVDHYKNPRNFSEMKDADLVGKGANASCGDMVEFFIKGEGKVDEVSFRGIGCALSTAASSMLTEKIKGMSFNDLRNMNYKDLEDLMGIEISPTRMKCVELPLKTVKKLLSK